MKKPLNYGHLHYLWIVGREGGINKASEVLDVSPSTISAQISRLEQDHGVRLFHKVGRNLQLTEAGHLAFGYAEEIFSLGREMTHALHGWSTQGPRLLHVGVADAVPKTVACRLLLPAVERIPELRLVCREDQPDRLLAELAIRHLDLVLLDAEPEPSLPIRVQGHRLAAWRIAIFGIPSLAQNYGASFPISLEGAPMLLPTAESSIRRSLDRWFEVNGVQPRVVGEFADSALMKTFSESGSGLFPAPSAVAESIERQHGVACLGELKDAEVSYWAVSIQRRLEHPGVDAIIGSPASD